MPLWTFTLAGQEARRVEVLLKEKHES
jgi:hypothetical protein